ncbi:MAG: NUDIX domain-containing protein [Balneolaceae bacterium]
MATKRLIDLYPYRMTGKRPEFLIFQRAKGKIYAGQWRMVGGKVQPGETSWQAALRELKEETGLTPETLWTIPRINQFYEHSTDTIHAIPAFAAEIDAAAGIRLDDEHTEYRWIEAADAERYIAWPEQVSLIRLTHHILSSNKILSQWYVPF